MEGSAKRAYISHRKSVRCFDDFYEFLLNEFDNPPISSQATSHLKTTNHSSSFFPSNSSKPIDESNVQLGRTTEIINLTDHMPKSNFTKLFDSGTNHEVRPLAAMKTSIISNNSSSFALDSTVNDLRKAIVESLIKKNPKTFTGGKDDVHKWIDEIEHLLELAHIPDATRLDLISYSLRGDALEWFKNNRSNFNSWLGFIHELKRAFTSSFHAELAFQRLESYSQGENQSIRTFFNEVLKLCKEADPTMSESSKLKNLLYKAKPSIQFEVRKKKPTTTNQFLEYAKEAEELFQLSNINSDMNSSTNHYLISAPPPLISAPNAAMLPAFRNPPYNPAKNTTYTPSNNPVYDPSNSPTYSSPTRPSRPYSPNLYRNNPSPYRSTFPHSQRFFDNQSPSQTPNVSRHHHPSQYPPRHKYPYRSPPPSHDANPNHSKQTRTNSSRSGRAQQHTVNTINPSYSSTSNELSKELFTSITCSRCNQVGHEVSAYPNF